MSVTSSYFRQNVTFLVLGFRGSGELPWYADGTRNVCYHEGINPSLSICRRHKSSQCDVCANWPLWVLCAPWEHICIYFCCWPAWVKLSSCKLLHPIDSHRTLLGPTFCPFAYLRTIWMCGGYSDRWYADSALWYVSGTLCHIPAVPATRYLVLGTWYLAWGNSYQWCMVPTVIGNRGCWHRSHYQMGSTECLCGHVA